MVQDFFEDGESQLYVGKLFLLLVAKQMGNILQAEIDAMLYKKDHILIWLNQLRAFHDLVENQLKIRNSEKEIPFYTYIINGTKLEKLEVTIKEKYKFEKWLEEIEKMFERNMRTESLDINERAKYINDKKILFELSRFQRELYHEANKKHLIMPDVKVNMKDLAKSDWIDRDVKKDLFN